MDLESGKRQLKGYVTKNRYYILILLAGILILMLPEKAEEPVKVNGEKVTQPELQEQLTNILDDISGVGKVQVLLTEASGTDVIYQVDENRNQSDLDTVIVMNSQREEAGLIKQVIPPDYRGALVVCQGGDKASVRLAVVEAVRSVTGLSSDCITVLKMK